MGRQKLLLPWAGRPVVRHIVDVLLASGLPEVLVVTGRDHEPIQAALSDVPCVRNPDPDRGMLSSVRIALERVDPDQTAAVLLALGDQPGLTTHLVRRLVDAWSEDPGRLVRPIQGGRRGHPLVIPVSYRTEILEEFDAEGLKGLLRRYPERICDVEVEDPGAVTDIDTPSDYEQEWERWNRMQGG